MATTPANILIVDDEFSVRDSLFNWFRKDGYDVTTAENATEALKAMQDRKYQVILLDIKMPGMDGMELQEHIHRIDPQVAVIMLTAFASVDTAVRALKQGAFDYVAKPVDPDELSHLVQRALEQRRLREENALLRGTIDELVAVERIVGDSPPMRKVMELVEHVSKTDATVLIRGESGTGKEIIARAIHANSKRRYFPVWGFFGPILPTFTDSDEAIAEVLREMARSGAGRVVVDRLNLYPRVWARVRRLLSREFPDRLAAVEAIKANPGAYEADLAGRVEEIGRSVGIAVETCF